ncbi:MAG TPA: DUF6152 family protein [Steroidobacteraceae bacterium]|nr:DUF6152 family protein [Steroidobacteraceae bacterium]
MRVLPGCTQRWRALACIAALGVAAPALAHHSFAMFDHDHQVKLTGTVKYFQWTNPHVYIYLDAMSPAGATKNYTIECASPGILDRVGWKWNMVKVGDKVTTIIAPLRSGEAGGLLKEITLPDGRKFNNGPAAGKANIH